jgi:hypothetical protein
MAEVTLTMLADIAWMRLLVARDYCAPFASLIESGHRKAQDRGAGTRVANSLELHESHESQESQSPGSQL